MAEEFDELLITTGVDALVRLVKEKQKIELDIAAKLLNIPINTLEDWAHILEEEGIIKLEYKITKVYLLWVPATEQEIVKEKEEIKIEQKTVEKEITALRGRIEPEIESFEELKKSFSQAYGKIAPKMNELERTLAAIAPSAKESPFVQSIEKIDSRVEQLDSAIAKMKTELDEMKARATKPAEIKTKALESVKKEVEGLNESLGVLRAKIDKAAQILPGEMPKGADMKKTFDALKKDVTAVKDACSEIKDDMASLHESTEIMKEMGNEIAKYEEDISRMRGEVNSLVSSSEELSRKSAVMADKMKSDLELLERFTDTIDTAKSVLARFPTQDKLEKQLEEINDKEEKLAGKLDALERIAEMMPRDINTEFESLKKKVDLEKKELAAENDALVKSITEQSGIYASFQKIREKTLVSMQLYLTQIKDMNSELDKIRKQVKEAEKMLEEEGRDKLKKKNLADIMKSAGELRENKQTLDQLNNSFQGISETVEDLKRQIDLLGKKAQFFDMRSGGPAAPAPTEKEREETVQQIKLTKNEEEEFKKKREELRELIKKLWEES